MILPAILFLCGSLLLLYWPGTLPSFTWLLLMAALAVALCLRRHFRWLALPLGFAWAWLHAAHQLTQTFPDSWVGQNIVMQGQVASLPQKNEHHLRFIFHCRQWQPPGFDTISCDQRVRLNWYYPDRLPQIGERWQLTVRLKPPIGFMNPGGFDYEKWLFQQHISATGYVYQKGTQRLLSQAPTGITAVRARLATRIRTALADHDGHGGVLALALGIRDDLTAQDWRRFQATGTSHLIAISGLHIGLVSLLGLGLGRWLWSRSQRLTNWLPAQRFGLLLAVMLAMLYTALAGYSIPTQRALIMVVALALGSFLHRDTSPWNTLALALLAVVLWDPFSLLDIGFWLSFTAVGVIFGLMTRRPQQSDQRFQGARIAFLLTLSLFPLTLVFFHYVSLVAPLANLVAVPWVSVVVLPLSLLGSLCIALLPPLGEFLLQLAASCFSILNTLLDTVCQLPFTGLNLPAPSSFAALLAFIGILWLLAPRHMPARALGALLLLPAINPVASSPPSGVAQVALLDVGQGLSAVVQTRQHTLVFDTGPRYSSGFNTGDAVVQPYLLQHGVTAIDRLIISHGDNDHIGGAQALDNGMPVYRVLSSVPEEIDWRYSQPCLSGQHWQWDGVNFEILNPAADSLWQGNDNSCVLKVTAGTHSLLLTGDIEARGERRILANHSRALAADVLIAPHHGSRSSSTDAFIDAVAPDWVLFPAGRHNRYHFPAQNVVARYARRGIRRMTTGQAGAIEFQLGDEAPVPRSFRLSTPAIWRKYN